MRSTTKNSFGMCTVFSLPFGIDLVHLFPPLPLGEEDSGTGDHAAKAMMARTRRYRTSGSRGILTAYQLGQSKDTIMYTQIPSQDVSTRHDLVKVTDSDRYRLGEVTAVMAGRDRVSITAIIDGETVTKTYSFDQPVDVFIREMPDR